LEFCSHGVDRPGKALMRDPLTIASRVSWCRPGSR
jgi:hypothetical protein